MTNPDLKRPTNESPKDGQIIDFSRVKKTLENESGLTKENREDEIKDVLFKELIASRLIDLFYKDLEDAGVSEDITDQLTVKFSEVESTPELLNYLTIPYSVRAINFPRYSELSAEEIFSQLKKVSQLEGFASAEDCPKIGFHVSGDKIAKSKDSNGRVKWEKDGAEEGDLGPGKRAFASDSYKGLYKEKQANYLYVVRIMGDKGLYDATQGWHHAASFPIVAEFDMGEILDSFNEIIDSNKEELELAI